MHIFDQHLCSARDVELEVGKLQMIAIRGM